MDGSTQDSGPGGTQLAARLRGLTTTVFDEMSELARRHGAVNLGQGVPDDDPPRMMVDAVRAAMDAGHNQYAPGAGVPELRRAVADHQQRFYGLIYDPDDEVTITFGATEALSSALLGLCEPGDEVVVIEPAYDVYAAVATFCGVRVRAVPMTPPDWSSDEPAWGLDLDRMAAAISPATRLLFVNTPHNPTGVVFGAEILDALSAMCVANDVIAVTDEVYEHLVFDGEHLPIATRAGMRERTVTISSAGKTFSCTGWKIGWACAPPALTDAVRLAKQYLTFSGGTPFQHGVCRGLMADNSLFTAPAAMLAERRDLLCDGLSAMGVPFTRSAGTYFVTADLAPIGHDDAYAFCRWAPEAIGLAAVPVSAFVRDPGPVRSVVRFAVCKQEEALLDGVQRLAQAVR